MPRLEVSRRLNATDAGRAVALFARATAAGRATLSESKRLSFEDPDSGELTALLVRDEGSAGLLGYGQLAGARATFSLETVLDPDASNAEGLATALLEAAQSEVAQRGGGELHYWVGRADTAEASAARAAGIARERRLLRMDVRLPLDASTTKYASIPTRAFVVGEDEDAFLECNARAFSDHPEQGAWQIATVHDRERQPWFDPEGFRLAERDGKLAGFCWTKIHDEDEPAVGEIYVIGVDPAAQGQGLGRGLVLAGLSYLAEKGLGRAMLYVDADNVAAVALYEALGFSTEEEQLALVGLVEARRA